MSENFNRLFDLAKKSNSRLIVYDPQGGQHLAILGIDDFEQLLSSGGEASSVPAFSAPSKPMAAKELPQSTVAEPLANDEEPLYYEEISQEQEDELVASPPSLESEEKDEAEVESESESETSMEAEAEAQIPRQSEPAAENPEEPPAVDSATSTVAHPTSRDWHRLSDVLRQVHPEITHPEGAPVATPATPTTPTPVPYADHPETTDSDEPDTPVFLEEPVE